jgi:hypothetical protein
LVIQGYVKEVYVHCMIPGHTKFEVDSFFGNLKRTKVRPHKILHPQDLVDSCNCVKKWNAELCWPIQDWRSEVEKYYNRIDGISSWRAFLISKEGLKHKNECTDNDWSDVINFCKVSTNQLPQLNPVNIKTIPLSEKKKEGIRACLQYITEPLPQEFWQRMLQTGEEETNSSQSELESQILEIRESQRPQESSSNDRSSGISIGELVNVEESTSNSAIPSSSRSNRKRSRSQSERGQPGRGRKRGRGRGRGRRKK